MFRVHLIDCDKASSDKDKQFAQVHGQTGWVSYVNILGSIFVFI